MFETSDKIGRVTLLLSVAKYHLFVFEMENDVFQSIKEIESRKVQPTIDKALKNVMYRKSLRFPPLGLSYEEILGHKITDKIRIT